MISFVFSARRDSCSGKLSKAIRKHTDRAIGLAREAGHGQVLALALDVGTVLGGAVHVVEVTTAKGSGAATVVVVGLRERTGRGDGVVLGAVGRGAGRCAD